MIFLKKNSLKRYKIYIIFSFAFFVGVTFAQTKIQAVNEEPRGTANLKINPNPETVTKVYPIGKGFKSGTTIETTNTSLTLGANGNSQLLAPHTIHKIKFDGVREQHITYTGKVVHYVNNKNSEYAISGKGIRFKSITTVFEVEVKGNKTRVKSIEGIVNTFQKVPVKLNNSFANGKKTKSNLSTTNFKSIQDGQELYFDSNPEPKPFASIQQALTFFEQELKQHQSMSFPEEQLADDNALIGELYLDLNEPNKAKTFFEKAIDYYENTGFSDQHLADLYVNLTEVSYDLENKNDFLYYGNKAIDLLIYENNFNEEDLYYAELEGDRFMISDIRKDLNYNYWNIAWIHEISGRQSDADYYYKLANDYN